MSEIAYEVVSSAPTDAVVGLYQAGGWWHEDPVNRTIIPQMIRGSFCFLVAREPDGRVVGMGRVISDGVSDAYIQDVVVLDACRGRGIGREIVRRGFYEPLGFHALAGYELMIHGGEPDGR
jgi:spermidine synthase